MPRFLLSIATAFFILMGATTAYAFEEVNTGYFNDTALHGFDSARYHTEGAPVEGSGDFIVTYKGAEWRFADQQSRDLFASDPERYAPQFGGYCSNQMSLGNLADVDPGVWLIHKDKLYFFGHQAGKDRWISTGIEDRIKDAEKNWQAFLAN